MVIIGKTTSYTYTNLTTEYFNELHKHNTCKIHYLLY